MRSFTSKLLVIYIKVLYAIGTVNLVFLISINLFLSLLTEYVVVR